MQRASASRCRLSRQVDAQSPGGRGEFTVNNRISAWEGVTGWRATRLRVLYLSGVAFDTHASPSGGLAEDPCVVHKRVLSAATLTERHEPLLASTRAVASAADMPRHERCANEAAFVFGVNEGLRCGVAHALARCPSVCKCQHRTHECGHGAHLQDSPGSSVSYSFCAHNATNVSNTQSPGPKPCPQSLWLCDAAFGSFK